MKTFSWHPYFSQHFLQRCGFKEFVHDPQIQTPQINPFRWYAKADEKRIDCACEKESCEEMSGWQPIKTHPANERMDLWEVDEHGQGKRIVDAIWECGEGFCSLRDKKTLWRRDANFTHWSKPLQPPKKLNRR